MAAAAPAPPGPGWQRAEAESRAWLAPFLERLRDAGPEVVELGCGPGLDARVLAGEGFRVVGCDLRLDSPRPVPCFVADLGRALPVRDQVADVVLASLSLHYFAWSQTLQAVAEAHRILRDGGRLLVRVNASDDLAHGAGDGYEVEPGLRRIGERHKRFFTGDDVRAVLGTSFEVEHLRHATIARYDAPKQVWECLARPATPGGRSSPR